ncbi:MAG: hypothetical protein OWT27_06380 [Firmicutes bacterium]|nr:hypothetical protein [Bacillota bacterium]
MRAPAKGGASCCLGVDNVVDVGKSGWRLPRLHAPQARWAESRGLALGG